MNNMLFTIFILGALSVLFIYAKRHGNEKNFLISVGVGGLALLLIATADTIIAGIAANHVESKFASVLGVSPLLADVIYYAVFGLVGFAYWYFVRQKKSFNLFLIVILGVGPVLMYLALYFGSRDWKFNPTSGLATQCYVVTRSGVITHKVDVSKPYFDPATGQKCTPFTAELAQKLEILDARIKSGKPIVAVDPQKSTWFSPVTGETMLWYSKNKDGKLTFFDLPGFNPKTGVALIAVTNQMQSDWTADQDAQNAKIVENNNRELSLQHSQHLAELYGVNTFGKGDKLVVLSSDEQPDSRLFQEFITSELANNGLTVIQGSKGVALQTAFDARNYKDVSDSGLLKRVQSVSLLRISAGCRETTSVSGAYVCDARVSKSLATQLHNTMQQSNHAENAVDVTKEQNLSAMARLIVAKIKG